MAVHLANDKYDGSSACGVPAYVGIETTLTYADVDCSTCRTYIPNFAKRTRIKLTVEVDLDPVPGVFHTAESARECVQSLLENGIPFYNPTVLKGN